MSIEIVKKQIAEFLSSSLPEVMAIKGAWGIGKTYTWKKLLLEAKKNKNISLKSYSYISLFGINSLDTFKFSIFLNVINSGLIGTESNFDDNTSKNNIIARIKTLPRKFFGLFKGSSVSFPLAKKLEL